MNRHQRITHVDSSGAVIFCQIWFPAKLESSSHKKQPAETTKRVPTPWIRLSRKRCTCILYHRLRSARHLNTGLVVGDTISSSRSLRFRPGFFTMDKT